MSNNTRPMDPAAEPADERQWMVRQQREFLDAVANGSAYKVTRATHRGFLIEIVTALRPDGRAQITAETTNPVDGSTYTRFWLVDEPRSAHALATALRESCAHIESLLESATKNA